MAPYFLTVDEVIEIHTDQIARYGGSQGIRETELLQSALAMPQAGFGDQYFHTDLYEMAAAYLFHLVQNHPFVDGNKRVGAASALLFLEINGHEVMVTNEALVETVLSVAQGKMIKPAITEFFRKHARK